MSRYNIKINGKHHRFIKQQIASFQINQTEITKMLSDPKIAADNEFNPITVTRQAVQIAISQYDKAELGQMRAVYLTDYGDIPLAFRKERIKELVRMYNKLANQRKTITLRAGLLRQIKDEVGEDIDKLAEALRGLTVQHNQHNIFYFDGESDRKRQADSNLAAIFGRNGSGNGDRPDRSRLPRSVSTD